MMRKGPLVIGTSSLGTMIRVVQRRPSVASTHTRMACRTAKTASKGTLTGAPPTVAHKTASHEACIRTMTG